MKLRVLDRSTIADALVEIHDSLDRDPIIEEEDPRPELVDRLKALLEKYGGAPYALPVGI
jgi:hypothetical protein